MSFPKVNNFSRRQFIQLGTLGGCFGFSDYFRAARSFQQVATERTAVLVFLKGGPAHQDTFDLKPDAPAEYRGEFRPIKTNVAGVEIC